MTAEISPRLHHVQCLNPRGLHRMAYWEWGDAGNPQVLLCVHGLTRQGRDFDVLARAMSDRYRVVCPDVVGRGRSDWLPEPMNYGVPQYVADMVTLLARLDAATLDWVGTSMGGLIAMGLAGLPGHPIRRLVLNDVGPRLEPAAIARIGSYVGQPGRWATVAEAAAHFRVLAPGFGPHTDAQWLALSRPQLVPDGAGFKLHYDPAIAKPFKSLTPELAAGGEALMWAGWDRTACPTLLLRGADSDLLSAATAEEMGRRGPKARCLTFAGVGHAPTLVQDDQVGAVREFLLNG